MTHTQQRENLQKLIEVTSGQIRALKWARNVVRNQVRREQKEKVSPEYQGRKEAQIAEFWRLYDAVQKQLSQRYEKLDALQEDYRTL